MSRNEAVGGWRLAVSQNARSAFDAVSSALLASRSLDRCSSYQPLTANR
jgi:hypothetical protein